MHKRRSEQCAPGVEQRFQMPKNRALARPTSSQTMHDIIQRKGIETTHIEIDRLQHVSPIDLRRVARNAVRAARKTMVVEVKQRDAWSVRKSRMVQVIPSPYPYFEVVVA